MGKPKLPKKDRASTREKKRRSSLNLAMKQYAEVDGKLQRLDKERRLLARDLGQLVAQIDRHTTSVQASTLADVVVRTARMNAGHPAEMTPGEVREKKRTEARLKRRTTRYRDKQQKMLLPTGTTPGPARRKA